MISPDTRWTNRDTNANSLSCRPQQAIKKVATGTKFRAAITRLLTSIEDSQHHFVLTLRPNDMHQPRFVEPALLLRQLSGMRVADTVAAVRQGFEHRFSLLDFYERYVILHLDVMKSHTGYARLEA